MTKHVNTDDNPMRTDYVIHFRLKEILDRRDLSIHAFAKQIEYRFETVRQMYNGQSKRVPVELIERICNELNCDVGDIMTMIPRQD